MKLTLTLIFVFFITGLSAQNISNIYGRKTFSLNGKWNYIIDQYETGYYDYRYTPYDQRKNPNDGFFMDKTPTDKTQLIEYSFDASPTLMVPGDWNSQDDRLLYYEGTIWYRKKFSYEPAANNRVYLCFGAANYETDVYLNGKKLGKHIGGFTPFQFEVTQLLKASNSLVVKVDNKRRRDGVPTLNTDWWNYGGITRDVMLVEVPQNYIADYSVQLQKGSLNKVAGFVQLADKTAGHKVSVEIPELKQTIQATTDTLGRAAFTGTLKNVKLWSPENPKLYKVQITGGEDVVTEEIGFRSVSTKGHDILLNGKSVFLRGICIHEENAMRGGRAYSPEDAAMLLGWAKELNCNYVRLAHYPHNEYMARLADKMGIMVWEEIPVYWTIQWDNPSTFDNARNQLTDMIERDKNRASVVIWSMANETPVSEARNQFLGNLVKQARSLDSTRLISAALEVRHNKQNPNIVSVEDPFSEYTDIVNFNQYIGWYGGLPATCDQITWDIKYDKPVMISEFGGDALQGLHGDSLTRWSEEYQADLYDHTLRMLDKIPQFRGVSPWILCDFRSPRRLLPNIQDGWNRKGVIGQNGTKKKAWFILKDYYDHKAKTAK